jgi:hypothetical protein
MTVLGTDKDILGRLSDSDDVNDVAIGPLFRKLEIGGIMDSFPQIGSLQRSHSQIGSVFGATAVAVFCKSRLNITRCPDALQFDCTEAYPHYANRRLGWREEWI